MILNLTKKQAKVLDRIIVNINKETLTVEEELVSRDIAIKFWTSAKKAKIEL